MRLELTFTGDEKGGNDGGKGYWREAESETIQTRKDDRMSQDQKRGVTKSMEGGGSLLQITEIKESELEALHREHEEKVQKKQELKKKIESTKQRMEEMKAGIPEDKMESFNTLSNKYNSLKEEYNEMLAELSSESSE
ncbi:hypothetical protein K1719_011273 [Acacia pycnantha]|nr:hypothetical protein K1719_011273 [Acacia pycnantha]